MNLKSNKNGLALIEFMFIIFLLGISLLGVGFILADDGEADQERRKAQIISVDKNGNELWRVYDLGRYIYYMPKGETSWQIYEGKSLEQMGVK